MNKSLFRRLGWALYTIVFVIAVLLLLLAGRYYKVGTSHEVLLHLGSDLLAVALIFFFVDQIFRWNPEEEQQKQQEAFLDSAKEQLAQTWAALNQYEQQFQRVLEKSLGGTYLSGDQEIYRSAIRLYESVSDQVRVVQIAGGPQPPDWYGETAAKILSAKKSCGKLVKFDGLLVLDLENLPKDFVARMAARLSIYDRHGVADLVSVYLLHSPHPVGLAVFIVDRKHAHISLTKKSGIKNLQSAIVFENQPLIAADLADWFDQLVVRSAMPYETWLQSHTEGGNAKPNA